MNKKLLFLFLTVLFENTAFAQSHSFSDDFESYEVDDYLCLNSNRWITWLNLPGTSQDVLITNEESKSGSKAIKLLDTNEEYDQYIILPYSNEKIISGGLNTKMSLLIETNAKLKFRAEPEVSGSTALSVLFEAGGVGKINNSKNETILLFDYPDGEWFTFELDINFEANKWHLEIDGNCVGTFANNKNSIAALDFFPTKDDLFFVDDFSYSYISSGHEIENDARTTLKSNYLYGYEGDKIEFFGELINGGSEVITSAELLFEFGQDEFQVNLTDLDIKNRESILFDVESDYFLANQITEAVLKIKSINGGEFSDEDFCNDNSYLTLKGVSPADHKKIIAEEGTARWCHGCPFGIVKAKYMIRKYPDRFIPIAVHYNDPMSFSDYEDNLEYEFIPRVVINRKVIIYPDILEEIYLDEVRNESLSSSIHGARFDEDSRELQISLLTTCRGLITNQHKVNIVLTEDEVQGVGQFWSQLNWYSNKEDLIDVDGLNWKDLPFVVPAEQMKYDHVARAILAPFAGLENSFEENVSSGEEKLFNFSYTVPESFDLSKMNIVSMLINPDGTINTGEQTTVLESLENGYLELTSTNDIQLTNATHIYPNPTNGTSTISINLSEYTDIEVQLLDLTGRVMLEKKFDNSIGYFITTVDISSIPAGNYIVKIHAGEQFTTEKLVIAR